MPSRTLPNLGLTGFFDTGEDGWGDSMNLNLLLLSALVQGGVKEIVSATPVSPVNGEIFLFSAAHPTEPSHIAIRDNDAWVFVEPVEGWRVYDRNGGNLMLFDGSAWVVFSGGGGGGPVAVDDDGSEIVSTASRINFTGAGVSVTDSGAGEATVNIPGGGGGSGGEATPVYPHAPRLADFTQRNIVGPATATDIDRGIRISSPAETTNNLRMLTVPILSEPATLTCKFSGVFLRRSFVAVGAVLGNTSNNQWRTIRSFAQDTMPDVAWGFGTHFGVTDQANAQTVGGVGILPTNEFWLRVVNDGTNRIAFISQDGTAWQEVVREPASTFSANVIGVVFSNRVLSPFSNMSANSVGHVVLEYFEYCPTADVTAITSGFLQQALPVAVTPKYRLLGGTAAAIQLSDVDGIVETGSTSATLVNLPSNADEAIPVGSAVTVVQGQTGAVTIKAAIGVTLNGIDEGEATISGRYGAVSFFKRDTNAWIIVQGPHGGVS